MYLLNIMHGYVLYLIMRVYSSGVEQRAFNLVVLGSIPNTPISHTEVLVAMLTTAHIPYTDGLVAERPKAAVC